MISCLWAGNGKMWSFYFLPFPSSHSYSHFHSHETSLVIPIPMGISWDPRDPWEFPIYTHLYFNARHFFSSHFAVFHLIRLNTKSFISVSVAGFLIRLQLSEEYQLAERLTLLPQ